MNAPVPDSAGGEAELIFNGSQLTVKINARGLTPGMHEMHIHLKKDGSVSSCPTTESDKNKDKRIDDMKRILYRGRFMFR